MRVTYLLFAIAVVSLYGCGGPNGAEHAPSAAVPDSSRLSAGREAEWQAGDELLSVMGSVQGKVVADLFAGDGYYTWKMLDAGARVLAIDDDPAKIEALEARKKADGIGDDRLLIRQTTPGVTGLMPDEVDLALVTRELSTLGDRAAWFSQLLADVRAPRTVYIVNYLPQQTPVGPPLSQRMGYNTVSNELSEFGYRDIGVMYKKMPYRYIIFASVPPMDQ